MNFVNDDLIKLEELAVGTMKAVDILDQTGQRKAAFTKQGISSM
jgi:hypothetical protein